MELIQTDSVEIITRYTALHGFKTVISLSYKFTGEASSSLEESFINLVAEEKSKLFKYYIDNINVVTKKLKRYELQKRVIMQNGGPRRSLFNFWKQNDELNYTKLLKNISDLKSSLDYYNEKASQPITDDIKYGLLLKFISENGYNSEKVTFSGQGTSLVQSDLWIRQA